MTGKSDLTCTAENHIQSENADWLQSDRVFFLFFFSLNFLMNGDLSPWL